MNSSFNSTIRNSANTELPMQYGRLQNVQRVQWYDVSAFHLDLNRSLLTQVNWGNPSLLEQARRISAPAN